MKMRHYARIGDRRPVSVSWDTGAILHNALVRLKGKLPEPLRTRLIDLVDRFILRII